MKEMKMTDSGKPWYREPWPWILATGPFIVVIAGFVTLWLAIKSSDGLVAEDYYKKGLVVNQTIAQSERAEKLGLQARVKVTDDRLQLRLAAIDAEFRLPPTLYVTVSHPTRAGLDQAKVLTLTGDTYSGEYRLPASGHWLVLVEDEAKNWRLMGNVVLPAVGDTLIGGEKAIDQARTK